MARSCFRWAGLCFNSQPPGGGWAAPCFSSFTFAVSTHSRPEAAGTRVEYQLRRPVLFQLTAARRRLATVSCPVPSWAKSFNSQPPGGGWQFAGQARRNAGKVSTHSRPEAAGRRFPWPIRRCASFNSQPPGGGWKAVASFSLACSEFQLTAARRRLGIQASWSTKVLAFQLTAARRRLAAQVLFFSHFGRVSTHSRPEAAGVHLTVWFTRKIKFQLTAARRRLAEVFGVVFIRGKVSTHSRPEAAGPSTPKNCRRN